MIALQENKIKELPTHYIGRGVVRGFEFRQIYVTESGFIYEVDTGASIYYEVFRKRVNRRFACISYPRASSFGIWAWTTPDLERAKEILRELDPIEDSSTYNKDK